MKQIIISIIFCVLSHVCLAQRKNVLFVVADDMRPDIEAYLDVSNAFYPDIHTPNLNKFAEKSLTLTRAYCQQALCSPSRTSFMTGRRPDTTNVHEFGEYWRDVGGNFTSMAQYFKDSGYVSINAGKVFHPGDSSGNHDEAYSWFEQPFQDPGNEMWENKDYSWQVAEPEYDDTAPQRDTIIKDYVLDKMRELAPAAVSGEQPFLLAVGFEAVHLPFVSPRAFFDLYVNDSIDIAANPHVPEELPEIAYYNWREIRGYADVAALGVTGEYNTTLPDYFAIDLRRAYYATVSFVDSLFGELVDELEILGLTENTIVVFLADQGYHLGEHSEWGKRANFELANRVPLMLSIPGTTDVGRKSDAIVELVDLFPTIVEATGVDPIPLCPIDSSDIQLCHEGHSLVALAENEEQWKSAAFFQTPKNQSTHMGYAIRTDLYQYVRWVEYRDGPMWEDLWDEELYDVTQDPDMTVNVASYDEYEHVISELDAMHRAGWRDALPPITLQ